MHNTIQTYLSNVLTNQKSQRCGHCFLSRYHIYAVALKVPWKPYGMLTGTTALPSSSNVLASNTRRKVLLSWKY